MRPTGPVCEIYRKGHLDIFCQTALEETNEIMAMIGLVLKLFVTALAILHIGVTSSDSYETHIGHD